MKVSAYLHKLLTNLGAWFVKLLAAGRFKYFLEKKTQTEIFGSNKI